MRSASPLWLEIDSVVRNGNCSGCGACALLSPTVAMGNAGGYARPTRIASDEPDASASAAAEFRAICPGRTVTASHQPGRRSDRYFGEYVSVWTGWALDEETRYRGSSAGVITALTTWLLESGRATMVHGATGSDTAPSRTVPIRITTREEALRAAGSRYAPVGVAGQLEPDASGEALVGKPCEINAHRALQRQRSIDGESGPVYVSFFCAGVPTQRATDELVSALAQGQGPIDSVDYRGRGWPGSFRVEQGGEVRTMSYQESWGRHLGPTVQARCKICPDGTGRDADIAVGDFWSTTPDGFPDFEDADGRSVVIARTPRGHELLLGARRDGVLALLEMELEPVIRVQPLQVHRERTLWARMIGRALAGRPVPRYRGFGMTRTALRSWRRQPSALVGSWLRAVRARSSRIPE